MNILKYLFPLTLFASAWLAFNSTGIMCFITAIYAFGIFPFAEYLLQPQLKNFDTIEADAAKANKLYDWLLYLCVVLQVASMFYFLHCITNSHQTTSQLIGKTLSMGILCGVFGINVAHELGHRLSKAERRLAKISLATSLMMHFYVEHNKGHHKHAATPHDPASARYGESIYSFFARAIPGVYKSAWHIENTDIKKKYGRIWSIHNEMIMAHIYQGLAIVGVGIYFMSIKTAICFVIAALIGIMLLECIDYIQHYGLQRTLKESGLYERMQAHHSWDSHYPLGRLMLFELTRHSDHHYLASKKYQVLDAHGNAPQMPAGYPGSILLALVPPLWFKVMHPRIAQHEAMMLA
jgi:alkane 1-monooxygenase